MGDPKKQRKKFMKPPHPWQKSRIDEERALVKEYGLKNKRELWIMESQLKHYTNLAKEFVAGTEQDKVKATVLLNSLKKYGLIGEEAHLDDVLGLRLKNIMERRLQTLVLKKGLAKSTRQARQFIVHQHIIVGDKLVTAPSYLVTSAEEAKITFLPNSSLSSPDHPERTKDEAK
jgi:small subunit ribosomal protein S4